MKDEEEEDWSCESKGIISEEGPKDGSKVGNLDGSLIDDADRDADERKWEEIDGFPWICHDGIVWWTASVIVRSRWGYNF